MSASDKTGIRTAALARRGAVAPETRQSFAGRLAMLGPALVRSEEVPTADPVTAVFLPIRDEPDTRPLIDMLNRIGLTTALPVAGPIGTPLTFRRWAPGDPLEAGRFGVQVPLDAAPTLVPDTLFVPIAAFDRRGMRIGYGGGYYDATLAALRHAGPVRTIGIAFACQEELYLPSEPHDQRLDLVVTERDIILCEA